jgi:UV DNA damage endonuclease
MKGLTMKNRIGYACTPLTIPYKTSRSFILENFNEEKFYQCVRDNLSDLRKILEWNVQKHIYMFRISSDIIPFGSHSVNTLEWWKVFEKELLEIGELINSNGMRVSMHPGQYTVINSPNQDVVQRSSKDLEYHARFLDGLGVDYSNKLVLHVGGVYGDKPEALKRFVESYEHLPEAVKHRLVIENDDKNYTVKDVLEACDKLSIPAIYDNLHDSLNPCGMKAEEIFERVRETWQAVDGVPKFHYSEQDEIKRGGAHSKTINIESFMKYWNLASSFDSDVMLEVKDKELSAMKCINSMNPELKPAIRTQEWAHYKYLVMERNYKDYKECSRLVNSEVSMREVYSFIDRSLKKPFDRGNFINAALHVIGYVKHEIKPSEREAFEKLVAEEKLDAEKIKKLLSKLCKKYSADYMNSSYYFIY